MTAHKKDSRWATCVLPPRCGLCCRWVSTTPWAFPCCSQLMLPEVNRKLLQSWSFYSLYSALCEIKINIESNFFIRTSPRVEFLLTPQRHSSSHCPVRGVGSSSAMGILVCGEHPWVSRETFQLVLHVPPASATAGQCPWAAFPELSLFREPPQHRDLFGNTALSPTAEHSPRTRTQLSPDMKADVLEASYWGKSCVNLAVCIAILQAGLQLISSLSQAPPWDTEWWLSCPAPCSPLKLCIREGRSKQIPQK